MLDENNGKRLTPNQPENRIGARTAPLSRSWATSNEAADAVADFRHPVGLGEDLGVGVGGRHGGRGVLIA
jgi:hypothetical protein